MHPHTSHTLYKLMAKFIGEYKAKVDDKGRIVFPSAFKAGFDPEQELKFVVKKSLYSNCLEMYTYQQWEADSEALRSRLNFFKREHDTFWREYMRDTAEVAPDGKIGRILIPKNLLEKVGVGVGTEVIFSGSNHFIEIWPKDEFEARKMSPEAFVALAESIFG